MKVIGLKLTFITVYWFKNKLYMLENDGRFAVYNCSFPEFLSLVDGGDEALQKILKRRKTHVSEVPPKAQFVTVNSEETVVLYKVNSSNIEGVGWKDNKLYVKFKNGVVYEYQNVGPDLWEGFMQVDSKGSWLHWWIKINSDEYPYRIVKNLDYVTAAEPLANPGTPHKKGYMTGFSKAEKQPIGLIVFVKNK